ncbi:GNAT family N-acetyltransferase [Aliivibrio kagoshimensis]|uniref:GNAT family N-acetyltransferase n=1 Tax=Aliivibrio kagoshimensis TaxID=2910230 RepID=UPI003D0BD1F8
MFELQQPNNTDFNSLIIRGERLHLQSIDESFSQQIFTEFTTEITRYMMPKPAEVIEDTLDFIQHAKGLMTLGKEVFLVIINTETDEFLGCCGLHGRDENCTPEFGIWLKKGAHGHKYGVEAIKTLASWAVEHIVFEYATYPVDKDNVSSRQIAESLGGEVYKELKVTSMAGIVLDEVVYKIPYETIVMATTK